MNMKPKLCSYLFAGIITAIAFPAFAQDGGTLEQFRSSVKEQSYRDNYNGHARTLGAGQERYVTNPKDTQPTHSPRRWNKREKYEYEFRPDRPEQDNDAPKRAWGK